VTYKSDDKDRARQVARWLRHEFSPALPVRVFFTSKPGDPHAHTRPHEKHFSIHLNTHLNPTRDLLNHSIIHEWAHAMFVESPLEEDQGPHCDLYWFWEGRIYRRFYDQEGWKDSEGF
jgi:hypothetical protein